MRAKPSERTESRLLLLFVVLLIIALTATLVVVGNARDEAVVERDELQNQLNELGIDLKYTEHAIGMVESELITARESAEWYAYRYEYATDKYLDMLPRYQFLQDILALGYNNVVADLSDLRIPSNATESQINSLLESTPLYGKGWYFLESEREYGVNAIIMISIMRQESNLGRAGSLWRQNNFAGISDGRGGWQSFATPRDGIFALARLLGVHYLCYDGRFHRGVSLDAVNVLYAPLSDPLNHGWASGIRSHTRQALNRLED